MAPESLSPLILDANAHMRGVLRAVLSVIMVTACSERSRVIKAVNAGVDKFQVKPIGAVDVANRTNAVIERRRSFINVPAYFGPDQGRKTDPRFKGTWHRAADPGTVVI